ncbi:MAG: cytochrome c-type biogenesis protein CcmH [Gemmatimonadota bacterium]
MKITTTIVGRRGFFLGAASLLTAAALAAQQAEPTRAEPLAGQGPNGSLRDPYAAGRPVDPSTAQDNDENIKAIEHRIKCPCPCGLDVYTCRTTDFVCTYSPAAHREVLALLDQGKTAKEVEDAFVAKYGERALMAPVPHGFNLAGYLLPGTAILGAGAIMAMLLRRRAAVAAEMPAAMASGPAAPAATSAELERLRRALDDSER